MQSKRQISIILFTVRSSPLSYPEKLKKLRDIGYRSIQGGFAADLTPADHKALLDSLGMEMSCFSGSLEDIQRSPGRYAEAMRLMNCDEVMIGTMPTDCREDMDGYYRAAELINATGRELAKEGMYIAYHNHAQEFRRFKNGKTGMDILYENFDPAAVHFLPDTHWLQAGGADILQWLRKCEGRMQYLHVKDYRIAPANYETGIGDTQKQFAEIGAGNLAWREIIDTALACGVKSFIVEQDSTYGRDPFKSAAQSFQALRELGLDKE